MEMWRAEEKGEGVEEIGVYKYKDLGGIGHLCRQI